MVRLIYGLAIAVVVTVLLAIESAPDASRMAAPTATPTAIATAIPTEMPRVDAAIAPSASPPRTGRDIAGARIAVPRLGIDLPLSWGEIARDVPRDGYEGATPERVALVFPGSALPGSGGNTYIYSHARTGMFLALWTARAGDLVILSWPDAELRYTVGRIVPRVPPTETSWLDPAGPERLTLQTSTGPRASDPRFVAIALPVAVGQ